jgi:hypothetical protein
MIHDAQTFSSPRSYDFAFRNFYQVMLPIIGRRSLRTLTVSNYSASQLEHFGIAPRGAIDVVHNGADHCDMAKARPDATTRLGLTRGAMCSLWPRRRSTRTSVSCCAPFPIRRWPISTGAFRQVQHQLLYHPGLCHSGQCHLHRPHR